MAFWGSSFSFNGIPCDDFDLMLYDVGNTEQGEGRFASPVKIVEEVLPNRWKPYFYGVERDDKLEVQMVFGVNQRRVDEGSFLGRDELEAVATWLTGQEEYLWLEIDQPDLEYVRYKVICTGLDIVEYGDVPWALEAEFTCDSAYAYMYPQTFSYDVDGAMEIYFRNESSLGGYYYPEIEWCPTSGGGDFSLQNVTDSGRTTKFTDVPASIKSIVVDNDRGIITNDQDLNIYPYFNFKFFRLTRGVNDLIVTGTGTLNISCEFPVNMGG